MKQKKTGILWITLAFIVLFVGLSSEVNYNYVIACIVNGNQGNIIFSKESGFYEESFQLQIYAPTEEIYYTLDGSDPDETSIKYEGMITISDASENPNIYSARTDVTAGFLEEEVEKYCKEIFEGGYKVIRFQNMMLISVQL